MIKKPHIVLITLVLGALIIAGGLLLDAASPSIAADGPSTGVTLGVDRSEGLVINIYYSSQEQLNAVAGELDIWEVHKLPGIGPSAGYAVAAVVPAQKDWLVNQGYRVEIDPEKTAALQAPTAALDPRYYYFDNYVNNPNNRYIVNFMQQTNSSYPNLTELYDVGNAWLADNSGYHRDIWVLRLSNEDPAYGPVADKPPFFLFANIHAREVSTPEMAIRYIKYFTAGYNSQGGYGVDPDVTWLMNHHAVYVLVSENPDGRAINEADISQYWRKNVDNNDGCTDPNSWGTDLNRNSSFKWGCCGGSSGNACYETYRGPARASEPETQAFQNFALSIFKDWNGDNGDDTIAPASPDNAAGIFISLHSYQDEILWPFGFSQFGAPNYNQLKTIGHKLAKITTVMNPTGFLYTVDGSSDDWVYGKLGVAAFTYEIGPTYGDCADFFPPYGCQDGIDGKSRNFWKEMGPSFVYANKIAATPYITAYGPDATNLVVNPTDVPGGVPVDLAATVLDQRYAGDPLTPVAAAEYFIDAPGADGTGIAMSPSDGNWGGNSEDVKAVVDTSGLTEGKHYILVHGMNTSNIWGPFTAVFLNITTPQYGLLLTPAVASAQADPGQSITYSMQVKNVGLNADTYQLSIVSQWQAAAPATVGPLNPGESATFDVTVDVPAGAQNGESDTATITATSQANPSVKDASTLTSTANFYNLSLNPASAQGTGYPGGTVSYILNLTNQGNITDTFDLSNVSIWPVSIPTSIGPLGSGKSADVTVIVTVPVSAIPGDTDLAQITATSQGNNTKSQTSSLTTAALQAGPVVSPSSDAKSGDPGATVVYTLKLTNHNYVADTFSLTVNAGWTTDYPLTVGPIPPDGSMNVQVKVHVPTNLPGGSTDIAEITFTSSDPQLPTASATLVTTANTVYRFTVAPEQDTLTAYGTGFTVQYKVFITNTGNATDSYTLSAISHWPVDVPSPFGPLAQGETGTATITVHVPLDIQKGDTNDARIVIVSVGNTYFAAQLHLYTLTSWNSFYLPLAIKH